MTATHRFDDQVVVVTGAGNGLGRAYAMLFAARGARVLVNDLGGDIHGSGASTAPAQKTVDLIRAEGGIAECNGDSVATGEGGSAIIAQALDCWGRVDVVVNNAGAVISRGPIDQNEDAAFAQDLMVAAGGTFFVTKAVWRHMWERDYGRIINVSSSAFLGMMSSAGYPSAKGATWGLTRNLAYRAQSAGKNIKVNCIMPTAAARMTSLMGEEISAGMLTYYRPESATAPVAFLAHRDVPVSGEMFVTGGDQMRRVFVGISEGVQAPTGEMTVETISDDFERVMNPVGYTLATSAYDKVSMDKRVRWSAGLGTVF